MINSLDGWFGRTQHGPMHRFTISREGDFNGYDIEQLMQKYGIRIWGREMDGDTELAFLVKETQAVWAEYLMCRSGIPLTSPLLEPRHTHLHQQHLTDAENRTMPTPWDEKGIGPISFIDHLVDWIARYIP
ncbi:MAG: hypothetical protein AAF639_17410 [Chloroflexota bacterium]